MVTTGTFKVRGPSVSLSTCTVTVRGRAAGSGVMVTTGFKVRGPGSGVMVTTGFKVRGPGSGVMVTCAVKLLGPFVTFSAGRLALLLFVTVRVLFFLVMSALYLSLTLLVQRQRRSGFWDAPG